MSPAGAAHPYPPVVHRDMELTSEALAQTAAQAKGRGTAPEVLVVGKGLMLLALPLAKMRGLRVAFLPALGQGAWFVCSRFDFQSTQGALGAVGSTGGGP